MVQRRIVRGAFHSLLVVFERGRVVPLLERDLAVAKVSLLPAGAKRHGDVGMGDGHGVVLEAEIAEGQVAVNGTALGVVERAYHGIAVSASMGGVGELGVISSSDRAPSAGGGFS